MNWFYYLLICMISCLILMVLFKLYLFYQEQDTIACGEGIFPS